LREVPYLRCQPECSTGHSLKDCRRAGIRIGACQFFRSRLELRFVADAISQFVADTMNQHDWQLIVAIIGDRDSIVSTRQAKAWDNLSHPRAARIIPSIFMRIPHISERGRPICPRSTGTITSSKLLILGWLNERPSWNSTCT
jgi:hypothetical protein